jgi:hypothetical protein
MFQIFINYDRLIKISIKGQIERAEIDSDILAAPLSPIGLHL